MRIIGCCLAVVILTLFLTGTIGGEAMTYQLL